MDKLDELNRLWERSATTPVLYSDGMHSDDLAFFEAAHAYMPLLLEYFKVSRALLKVPAGQYIRQEGYQQRLNEITKELARG